MAICWCRAQYISCCCECESAVCGYNLHGMAYYKFSHSNRRMWSIFSMWDAFISHAHLNVCVIKATDQSLASLLAPTIHTIMIACYALAKALCDYILWIQKLYNPIHSHPKALCRCIYTIIYKYISISKKFFIVPVSTMSKTFPQPVPTVLNTLAHAHNHTYTTQTDGKRPKKCIY